MGYPFSEDSLLFGITKALKPWEDWFYKLPPLEQCKELERINKEIAEYEARPDVIAERKAEQERWDFFVDVFANACAQEEDRIFVEALRRGGGTRRDAPVLGIGAERHECSNHSRATKRKKKRGR